MMIRPGEVYEHPFEPLVVRVGTAESEGHELVFDLDVKASAPGVPPHIHPRMEEWFTVIEGKPEVLSADGEWKTLGPGEGIVVPPNTVHSWRPVGGNVRVLGRARPGDRFVEMWRQFMGLAQDGSSARMATTEEYLRRRPLEIVELEPLPVQFSASLPGARGRPN